MAISVFPQKEAPITMKSNYGESWKGREKGASDRANIPHKGKMTIGWVRGGAMGKVTRSLNLSTCT